MKLDYEKLTKAFALGEPILYRLAWAAFMNVPAALIGWAFFGQFWRLPWPKVSLVLLAPYVSVALLALTAYGITWVYMKAKRKWKKRKRLKRRK